MMDKNEAVQKLSKVARISVAHAEDSYDSLFEKPVVPQYVADWYEEHKNNLNEDIWAYLTSWADTKWDEFKYWMYHTGRNKAITTLVSMHQFGYEVEEKRYRVRLKAHKGKSDYLVMTNANGLRFYTDLYTENREHTRKELEANGFGWVFSCEGIEIEEVGE